MKKALPEYRLKSNKRWHPEEIEFVKTWYGKVKTDSIADVLNRSAIAVWQQCKTNGFKLHERIYSTTPIEAVFQGKVYHLQAFRYTRKENGATVDKTLVRKKIGRPRKHTPKTEKQSEPMAAHRRKPSEVQKKPNNKEQEANVKTFNPENKVLVQIDKKTWVYRDICNL